MKHSRSVKQEPNNILTDIETQEEETKTQISAANAAGHAEFAAGKLALDDEDVAGARKARAEAARAFAKSHAFTKVPGLKWEVAGEFKPTKGVEIKNTALAEALEDRFAFSKEELEQFTVAPKAHLSFKSFVLVVDKYLRPQLDVTDSMLQEHEELLLAFDLAIDVEVERLSRVAAGDAALAAARKKLERGDIAGSKEERATAAYAFQQANVDKRQEMMWLNDQIVEAVRMVIIFLRLCSFVCLCAFT
jgi:hypothetical protein